MRFMSNIRYSVRRYLRLLVPLHSPQRILLVFIVPLLLKHLVMKLMMRQVCLLLKLDGRVLLFTRRSLIRIMGNRHWIVLLRIVLSILVDLKRRALKKQKLSLIHRLLSRLLIRRDRRATSLIILLVAWARVRKLYRNRPLNLVALKIRRNTLISRKVYRK